MVKGAYVAKLSWGEVKYNYNIINLTDVILSHETELNRVPKLEDNDYIVIDTSNHEAAVHAFNLFYTSYVVNENNILYKFFK